MGFGNWRRIPIFGVFFLASVATGCGDDSGVGTTYPVTGAITMENVALPAHTTMVLFKPDAAKGNKSPFEPVGAVDGEGKYSLKTKGKPGAPPGWYKVIVSAHDGKLELSKEPRTVRPAPKSLVPAKYGSVYTTELTVEVVENLPRGPTI